MDLVLPVKPFQGLSTVIAPDAVGAVILVIHGLDLCYQLMPRDPNKMLPLVPSKADSCIC
jgi:hypothetical protein